MKRRGIITVFIVTLTVVCGAVLIRAEYARQMQLARAEAEQATTAAPAEAPNRSS